MGRMMLAQGFGGVTDFTLAGQKDQNVAGTDQGQLIDSVHDGVHQIALLAVALMT